MELPNKSTEELNQLAVDLVAGRVFTSAYLTNNGAEHMLTSVFMPLMFMADPLPPDTAMLYEYLSEAGERGINGYPCFMSFKALNNHDCDIVADKCQRLTEAMRTALASGDAAGSVSRE